MSPSSDAYRFLADAITSDMRLSPAQRLRVLVFEMLPEETVMAIAGAITAAAYEDRVPWDACKIQSAATSCIPLRCAAWTATSLFARTHKTGEHLGWMTACNIVAAVLRTEAKRVGK